MRRRGHIRMIDKAAALAAQVLEIPYEHRVLMSAEQVMSLLNFDHDPIPHVHGGSDEHFNLTGLSIMAHRQKTAKIDVPQIAKTDRIATENTRHQAIMAAKTALAGPDPAAVIQALAPVAKKQWPKRKLEGRPFQTKGKRRSGFGR